MNGFLIAGLAVAGNIAVTWLVCSIASKFHASHPRPNLSPHIHQSPEGTETGPMVYFADDRHGRPDREYRFNYKMVNGSWRAYILRMPNLCGRDAGAVATHRLFDNGQTYICWNAKVRTLKEMQTISRVWANHIQEYIATGQRFGPQ
jgi:hypothetical protein